MRLTLRDAHRVLELCGFLGVFAAILVSGPLAGATARVSVERAQIYNLAARSHGLLTEVALHGAFSDMDGASLALAERFAPLAGNPVISDGPQAPAAEPLPPELIPTGPDVTGAEAINDATPFSTAPNPAAQPFFLRASLEDSARAIDCLTKAIYYEAGFEGVDGGRAVAQVVLNRMRHPIFPKTVCGVVFQGYQLTTGCQFSFTCDGALLRGVPDADLWRQARKIAAEALNGYVYTKVGGATHYHARYVAPWWKPTVTKVAQVGAHIFYRWSGGLGLPQAFNGRYAGGERIYQPLPRKAAEQPSILVATLPADQTPAGRVRAILRVAGSDVMANEIATPDGGTVTIPTLGPGSISAAALTAPQTQAERIAARAYMQKTLRICGEGESPDTAICRRW